jgi:glutamate N-acetyltransferase/amino-acid N-acetyltransferase
MQVVQGGVTAASGFLASGVVANIKGKGGTKRDVAMVASRIPCTAAGLYTTNRVQAAPVLVSRPRTQAGVLHAIVVNSGNANACTGDQGLQDATEMARLAANELGVPEGQVAVCSTGVIGVALPMARIRDGVVRAAAALVPDGGPLAAEAILTTDTCDKQHAVRFDLDGVAVTVGGMAKGSGMIHPNMATMLGFVTTDAAISADALHEALRVATDRSFHAITVDGDTSTNDAVIALANGAAHNPLIQQGTPAFETFLVALQQVLVVLAKAIARDGEGATHLLEVVVRGARSEAEARTAAKAVCGSSLVKAAVFGKDANWGRVLCALGYSTAVFSADEVDLWLGDVPLMARGTPLPFDEQAALRVLEQPTVTFTADLHAGAAQATAWGCDLTYKYVEINGAYRT